MAASEECESGGEKLPRGSGWVVRLRRREIGAPTGGFPSPLWTEGVGDEGCGSVCAGSAHPPCRTVLQFHSATALQNVSAVDTTPPAVVARLARELGPACADVPAFRGAVERLGGTPVCNTQDEFRAVMRADAPLWREAVRVSGAKLE